MIDKLKAFAAAIYNKVVDEPLVTFGVVVAAVNAVANGSDWKVYASAVAVALLRFAVSPVLPRIEQ